MKRILVIMMAILTLSSTFCAPVLAADNADNTPESNIQAADNARTSQNVWYTRTYNGKQQKRLWSLTYGCWLTDWIDCD